VPVVINEIEVMEPPEPGPAPTQAAAPPTAAVTRDIVVRLMRDHERRQQRRVAN
jgi:hypothetical protein